MSLSADVADLPIASIKDDPVDHFLTGHCPKCDCEAQSACEQCGAYLRPGGAMRAFEIERLLGLIVLQRRVIYASLAARNTKFWIKCYLVASGDANAEGITMKEMARKSGVRTATVSKLCHIICAQFGFRPSAYMRDEATCAKFRLSNRRPRKLEPEQN
jgi:hypothetical protein